MSTDFPGEDSRPSDWVSQAEAARLHGVSRQAINKLVRAGKLRTLRIGGRVLVSRAQVESFRPQSPGRPRITADRDYEDIKTLLSNCDTETKRRILDFLKGQLPGHPLERRLGVSADIILEALDRAGDLTLRMFRGVIAEAAFDMFVVKGLAGWHNEALAGNPPYDFLLRDSVGPVRVQVKLQRSSGKIPLRTDPSSRQFLPGMFVVETQRTRGGTDKKTGGLTRPYRYGEFDILAVAMQPSSGRWDSFLYTVSNWLIPRGADSLELATLQPVAPSPNEDWTADFTECVSWFRAGIRKTIGGPRGGAGSR